MSTAVTRQPHDLLRAVEDLRNEFTLGRTRVAASAVVEDSVAVLPFINMSADPENEFLALVCFMIGNSRRLNVSLSYLSN